jgi:hypothetical protein
MRLVSAGTGDSLSNQPNQIQTGKLEANVLPKTWP